MKYSFLVILLLNLTSCDNGDIIPSLSDPTSSSQLGTLIVDFPITHPWLPINQIIRTDLRIAANTYDMYKGKFIQSANVTDNQEKYTFYLATGNYCLEAGIACLCGGDSCSGGGFPGNRWGQKFTSYNFIIVEGTTTELTVRFLK